MRKHPDGEPLHKRNSQHIQNLCKAFIDGNVAVLVGAGSSIACGYPGWNEFLRQLEQPLRQMLRDEYIHELRSFDLYHRLDKFAGHLGSKYLEIFGRTFSRKGDGQNAPEWLRTIYDLPMRLLLTTNYTPELEQVARFHPAEPLGKDPVPVKWYESERLSRALRRTDGRLRLVYLHGRYDDPPKVEMDNQRREWSRIVLGEKSYRYCYEHPGTLRQRLAAVIQTSTLLVVGASLQDEEFTRCLRLVNAIGGSGEPPHYAILPASEGTDVELQSLELRERYSLQPIYYPLVEVNGRESHEKLEVLLSEIAEGAARKSEVVASTARKQPEEARAVLAPRIEHPLLRAQDFEPRPAIMHAVEKFLGSSGGGVMALVGIGGAGKTAVVRECLDATLRGEDGFRLDSVFVWSFYDHPDSTAFFCALARYLTQSNPPVSASEPAAADRVRQASAGGKKNLFVLDGVERIQLERPTNIRIHGSLESTVLRQFFLWLIQTGVPSRALLTTRFPLPELASEEASPRMHVVDVDALTRQQARSLLRRRGVEGTDKELNDLLDHFGAHALTINHLGGVIATYLDGHATRYRELSDTPISRFEVGQSGAKLMRVLTAYEGYLDRSEPAVRDTLRRVAIFHRPIGFGQIEQVFLKDQRESEFPGRHHVLGELQYKTPHDLRQYLGRLVFLGFLREEPREGKMVYSIHPAVRDVVLSRLGKAHSVLAGAARSRLETDLDRVAGRPGVYTDDPQALDFIEEVIALCVDEDALGKSLDLYQHRFGGYRHVGLRLNDYLRGERVSRMVLDAFQQRPEPPSISASEKLVLKLEWIRFASKLGRNDEVLEAIQNGFEPSHPPVSKYRMAELICYHTSCSIESGLLKQAAGPARKALDVANSANDPRSRQWASFYSARLAHLTGDAKQAIEQYERCLRYQERADNPIAFSSRRPILYGLRGFDFQMALVRWGWVGEALEQAMRSEQIHKRRRWNDSAIHSLLVQAECFRIKKNFAEVSLRLGRAREWALETAQQEVLLWCHLIGARLSKDEYDYEGSLEAAAEGSRIARSCRFELFRMDLECVTADALLASGDIARAAEIAGSAASDADSSGYVWASRSAKRILASVYRLTGELEEYERLNQELRGFRRPGIPGSLFGRLAY